MVRRRRRRRTASGSESGKKVYVVYPVELRLRVIRDVIERGHSYGRSVISSTRCKRWEDGLFRASFRSVTDLRIAVTRALHDLDLTRAIAPLDTHKGHSTCAPRASSRRAAVVSRSGIPARAD